jgi:hypothetical protein
MYRKLAKVYVLPACVAFPSEPIPTIFGTFGDLVSFNSCVKFHVSSSRMPENWMRPQDSEVIHNTALHYHACNRLLTGNRVSRYFSNSVHVLA